MIYEYFHRPRFVPPFNILTYIYIGFKWFIRLLAFCFRLKPNNKTTLSRTFYDFIQRYSNGFKVQFENNEQMQQIILWENRITKEYYNKLKRGVDDNIQIKLAEQYQK
jgi:hypothetical protein